MFLCGIHDNDYQHHVEGSYIEIGIHYILLFTIKIDDNVGLQVKQNTKKNTQNKIQHPVN